MKGGRRLWAILLALDTVLLLVSAGSLAGTAWFRIFESPAPKPVSAARRVPVRPQAPQPAAPAKEAAKPAAPPPQPRSLEPELPAGSPGVAAPSLPRREAEPASAPEAKSKARAVEFSCRGKAKRMQLRGPFLVRTKGAKAMTRGKDGVWRSKVILLPGTYRYQCSADGKKGKVRTMAVP